MTTPLEADEDEYVTVKAYIGDPSKPNAPTIQLQMRRLVYIKLRERQRAKEAELGIGPPSGD